MSIIKCSYRYLHYKENISPIEYHYIDSNDQNLYLSEMLKICIKYIKDIDKSFKPENKIFAKDLDDIYNNKNDGFWIVHRKIRDEIKMYVYQRETKVGILYNTYEVHNHFDLMTIKCPKIVEESL